VERKQQLERSLAATIHNGEYVTEGNWMKIWIRDTTLWLMQLVPSWRRQLEKGSRVDGMTRYKYQPGLTFLPDCWGGGCFPQVYCVPNSCKGFDEEVASVTFTDDVIFANHKQGLLKIVILVDGVEEIPEARAALSDINRLSGGDLRSEEATFIVQRLSESAATQSDKPCTLNVSNDHTDVYRIASGAVFAESKLCHDRPKPQYYEAYHLKTEMRGRRFVILRPDRFVFAACNTKDELEQAVNQISKVLDGLESTSLRGPESKL
jgi:hypothetical protein